jgi:hypothetical protein
MKSPELIVSEELRPYHQPMLMVIPPEFRSGPMLKFEILSAKFAHKLELLSWDNELEPLRFMVSLSAADPKHLGCLVAQSAMHIRNVFKIQCSIVWREHVDDVLELCT